MNTTDNTQNDAESTDSPNIVEGSYYDHAEHGTVKAVSADADTVRYQLEETTTVDGEQIPIGKSEPVGEFAEQTDPAAVTAVADSIEVVGESTEPR